MWSKSSFTVPAVATIGFCLIGGTVPVAADVLHVPGDYPTIQEAIDAAMNGDEVEVHPGTYNETINFLGKAIRVYSTDGPDVTIIDAQQTGSVVTCGSGEESDTVLSGFVITNGSGFAGGMFNFATSPTVTNCTFSNNSSSSFGGGMHNFNSSPTVTNCTFVGNTAVIGGGGMYNEDGGVDTSPTVTNCMFSGNEAAFGGGMLNWSGGDATVTNCTFSGNSANFGGAILLDGFNKFKPCYLTVTNSILWNNIPNEISTCEDSLTSVAYSNVQGGWRGTGNINTDPFFVDPDSGDYHLAAGSPCIDAANNNTVPGGITTDLDGNPRFVDDPKTKDTGNGDAPIVDMGAYEFQVISCTWDLDGDDNVGTGDLILLLGSWGDPYDTADLIELLGNWGPCPK